MKDCLLTYISLTSEQQEALMSGKIIPNFGMKAAVKELWCARCSKGALIYDGYELDGGVRYYCNDCFRYSIDYSVR